MKIFKKIKKWFKGINWKEVIRTIFVAFVIFAIKAIMNVISKNVSDALTCKILKQEWYFSDVYNGALDGLDDSENFEALFSEWKNDNPDITIGNVSNYEELCDVCPEASREVFDKAFKFSSEYRSINGKMIYFDVNDGAVRNEDDTWRRYTWTIKDVDKTNKK